MLTVRSASLARTQGVLDLKAYPVRCSLIRFDAKEIITSAARRIAEKPTRLETSKPRH